MVLVYKVFSPNRACNNPEKIRAEYPRGKIYPSKEMRVFFDTEAQLELVDLHCW